MQVKASAEQSNMTSEPQKPVLGDTYPKPPELLHDGNLTLRRWKIADAPALHAAAEASLTELKAWMPWAKNGYTLDDAKAFITMTSPEWDAGKVYNYAVVVDNEIIGSFGLMDPVLGNTGMGMGYWLATPATGKGLATRAAGLLTRTAFDLGAELVQIWHHVDNGRSKAVPRRLGYRFLGEQLSPKVNEEGPHGFWQLDRDAGKRLDAEKPLDTEESH